MAVFPDALQLLRKDGKVIKTAVSNMGSNKVLLFFLLMTLHDTLH